MQVRYFTALITHFLILMAVAIGVSDKWWEGVIVAQE
jgi:hypothetical protein